MSNLNDNPYRHITPEELHIAMRRAHLERAKVIRSYFRALRAWLSGTNRRHDADPALRTVAGR
jgi:hypothetical protein